MADKEARSFSIDADLKRELQERNELNASQVVNDYLREFLAATDATADEVIIREINRQIAEIDEEIDDRQDKRERLVKRRENIKERSEAREQEQITEVLERLATVQADPNNKFVQEQADNLGMSAEELARQAADYHNKEYKGGNNNDDFRSL